MSPRTDRAARLAYVAAELKVIRENLTVLTGSPRASEVKMVLDLECAVAELARLAGRLRSRRGVPAVYVAPETREAARPEARS
jgi:hypothetical protein